MQHPSRIKEIVIAATIVAADSIMVVVLNAFGVSHKVSAAFAAGVGSGAVVVYIIMTNITLRQKRNKDKTN